MGTNKVVKRTKKMKKRGGELVDDGKSSGVVNVSKGNAKDDATEMNEDSVPEVVVKPRKSKKIRKIKKKDPLLSTEESNVVNAAEKYEPAEEDSSKGKKDNSKKARKNKRKHALVSDEQNTEVSVGEETEPVIDGSKRKKDKSKRSRKSKTNDTLVSSENITIANNTEDQPDAKEFSVGKNGKSKKAKKQKNASQSTVAEAKSVREIHEVAINEVYEIPSGDDDDSKGMKKWIKEYHERRPGIKVLQEQIDDFITAYDEQEEQAKREKEASLAEDGWTVVVHRKGGKKTTDTESGVAVGSVAEAAVREKMAKKKNKDVGLDFYRFQRKEANRSEIMKLQSKFEEDKKRIQQLRAARKFKPY
ncbi:hypothetical protein RND81_10G128500 [Saponaria officinalis]|uniref:Ribosomal RNA-processing protein 7 C-terminal domain-containing protein n=1 Tax=Saponaria officinalis TaxID=3572 RepID=A0AAW1I3V1_SAPOF